MIYYIEDLLLVTFEIFCCKIFYETFAQKRNKGKFWLDFIQLFLLCTLVTLIAEVLKNVFIVRQLSIILLISSIMCWQMKISYKKSLVLVILYEGLMLVEDYITLTVIGRLFIRNGTMPDDYNLASHLVTLLGKVLLFLCILIIRKQFKHKDMKLLGDTDWLRFLFFPIFTVVIIAAILSTFMYIETPKQATVLFVFAIGMAGMNIYAFYLINNILEKNSELHEKELFQIQVKNQAAMYYSISENFDKQKKKTHEYKNQIVCIESLLGKKQYIELENYVKNIYGDLNKELDLINTNNVIVNAILNTKYYEMTEKNITFVFRVNDLSELGMSDEDTVTILSNLLNNAIEACEQCKGQRIIKLKFVKEENKIIIAVKNTYEHVIRYENGEILSTKKEAEEHGIGIKNIIRLIDKYKGSYVIQEIEHEFLFSIIIPL